MRQLKKCAGEEDGKDYHFVSREKMQELIASGQFIEHTEFSGNLYGTSRAAVQDVLDSRRICILDIETKGVRAIKKTELKSRLVFLKPPSLEVLEQRLRARGTETEESLSKRLGAAKAEMEYGEAEGNFHVVIVNDTIEAAYAQLRQFVLPDIEELQPKEELPHRPVVLCGPSGSGKSTLMKLLIAEFPASLSFSVSHTTRQPRPGEEDGKDYHFVSRQRMEDLIATGQFIEHTEFSGNLYGTSRSSVVEVLKGGRVCLLDVSVQGVVALKATNLNPLLIFIKPPSVSHLEQRLVARGTETKGSLARRLGAAEAEIKFGEGEGNFHLVVTNDTVERAYRELRRFLLPLLRKAGPPHLQPCCLVMCGPSGAGVTSLAISLEASLPEDIQRVVSHTTRRQREQEKEGEDYFFVTEEQMEKMEANGDFVETVKYAGNMYGTSEDALQQVLESGRLAILEVDVQGVRKIRAKQEELGRVHYVFVTPGTTEEQEERLQKRETKGSLLRRLAATNGEVEYGLQEGNFDLVIVNRDPKTSLHQLRMLVEPSVRRLQPPGPVPLVLCGPSGSGKSTLMKLLIAEFGSFLGFSVSHTTRQPRPGTFL